MTLSFTKMHGCGNDFVMIDGRNGVPVTDLEALAAALCDRRRGLGADGMIVLQPSSGETDFSMLYINASGMPGEMCGNGARCAVRFAFDLGVAGRSMTFATAAGDVLGLVAPDHVTIEMPPPRDVQLDMDLDLGEERLLVHFALVGVPHAVVLVDQVAAYPVERLGPLLRHHPAFSAGCNANFVTLAEGGIAMRTYERGVEAETLACGTGAVACTAICHMLGLLPASATVHTRGNDLLEVHLERNDQGFSKATLSGPTETVAQGEIDVTFLRDRGLLPPR
ncbi:diaminopimelate epimerase [Rhodoligotrophos appendicifer]|uniref:diaminopimelate epimerase n=1 Tax=Rhodoligotrophos appendicifer TaxID=987056 RepID=UPI0011851E99|nr:diaminopimelate epimerase [Rhodoligotrophos appendicifer]